MAPGAMNSSYSPIQNTAAPAAVLIMPHQQDPAMRGPPRLLPIAGGGNTLYSPPRSRGVSNPQAPINKTPPCGVHRASCPLRAGGTTFFSPPRSAGCLTNPALSGGTALALSGEDLASTHPREG